jgi:hypothetical protein
MYVPENSKVRLQGMDAVGKSGYAWKLEVYIDSESDVVEKQVRIDERVIRTVVGNIHDQDQIIYFDNYFSSRKLLQDLNAEKVHACGTVSCIRKKSNKIERQQVSEMWQLRLSFMWHCFGNDEVEGQKRCPCCPTSMMQKVWHMYSKEEIMGHKQKYNAPEH